MLTIIVKWSEVLSNRVSTIVRRYIDHVKFAAFMVASFITFYRCIYIYIYMVVCVVWFCLIL